MPSSTSFPSNSIELLDLRVEETRHRSLAFVDDVFVRFRLDQVEVENALDTLFSKKLYVSAYIEGAPRSWTQADRIGSTVHLYKGAVVLGVYGIGNDDPDELMSHALRFAADKLNEPLETAVTLYGIKHNLEVHIEHKLRADRSHTQRAKLAHLLQGRKPLPPFFKFDK